MSSTSTAPSTTATPAEPVPDSSAFMAPSSSASTIRATKRKLEDALHSLDDAVSPSPGPTERPAKKAHTTRSIYSTLAKYGIRQKESSSVESDSLTKSTPHLAAILARTASRTRKALPFKIPGQATATPRPVSTSDYRPSSTVSFLARLATFKLSTYSNKPPVVDAVAASKCGWTNDGKDRLKCGMCGISWVVTGTEGMNRDAANALVEKQRLSLVESHKDGCPWKTRQCDDSIYRIPLQSPSSMVKDLKANAVALNTVLEAIETKHPLTSSQIQMLKSTVSSYSSPVIPPTETEPTSTPSETPEPLAQTDPSEAAILASLFGWSLAPSPPECPRIPSRSNSVLRSGSNTPSISRSSSVTPGRSSDAEGSSTRPIFRFGSPFPSTIESTKRDTALVHCTLCQRRVGLWAFAPPGELPSTGSLRKRTPAPQRPFDLLKEHRSYCPYVVRSTILSALPVPQSPTPIATLGRSDPSVTQLGQSGAVEGWRAVLTVVLRYGAGRRQKMGILRDFEERSESTANEEPMEVDGVQAMVAGVKSRGGKDLLRYVKGLLG